MDHSESQPPNRYYSLLGLGTDASTYAIRSAYKKLAMKWHPDKCVVPNRAEAKRKFQEIQEAYAVLSDERKRMLYDCGLYDPEDDDEEVEGFTSFLNEMSGMMADVQSSEAGKGSSFEELQQLFVNMFSADLAAFNNPSASSINFDKKRSGGGVNNDPTSFIESCIKESLSTSQTHTHYFFNDTFPYGSNANMSAPKKTKCGKVVPNGVSSNTCANGLINNGNGLHTTTHDYGFDNKGRR